MRTESLDPHYGIAPTRKQRIACITVVCALLLVTDTFAQRLASKDYGEWTFGPRVAGNSCLLSISPMEQNEMIFWYLFGAMGVEASYRLSERTRLDAQTILTSRHSGLDDGTYRSVIWLNYIDLPLTLQYALSRTDVDIFVSGGISVQYLVHARHKVSMGTIPFFDGNITSDLNRFDVAPMVGFGVRYQWNETLQLVADLTYQHGLLNVNKSYARYRPITTTGYNREIRYAVALLFSLDQQ